MTFLAADRDPPAAADGDDPEARTPAAPAELPRLPAHYLKHVWDGLARGAD